MIEPEERQDMSGELSHQDSTQQADISNVSFSSSQANSRALVAVKSGNESSIEKSGQHQTLVNGDLADRLEDYVVVNSDSESKYSMNNNERQTDASAKSEADKLTSSQQSHVDSTSIASTSGSRRSSIQERIRKSGSFMSRLNNGSKQDQSNNNNNNNFPTTLANAFSSLASITSNFSLGNSSTTNEIDRSRSSLNGALTIETASTSSKLSQANETRGDVFIRKAALERKNLIGLTKLIVKDLITSSLTSGRTIENECPSAIHLNNYFTLIDRVLKHGLKQNLLSNRSASLWSIIDNLSKYLKESTLMSESIRSLAHTKTPDGKIKAWIRLAMMQKKLPEYFNELLAQKDTLLREIYHDFAFMVNDEAHVFAGLIIGVNVIDCNFFVKDDNFDLMDDIIDLDPYLRIASNLDDATDETIEGAKGESQEGDQLKSMTKILDQKNYLEEWNKHQESTIKNLLVKIKSLEEQNSHLEMEAKVSEVRIAKLQEKRAGTPPIGGDATRTIIPGAALQIPDAIKSMINRNKSSTNISGISNTQSSSNNISATSTPVQIMKEPSNEERIQDDIKADRDSIGEHEVASVNVENETSQEGIRNASLTIDLEECKQKISKQEEELIGLRERLGILETSYRSALDKIRTLERDLDVQTSINSDKETTIKIYEKDIRDKQQQVDSLRTSLADAKKHNSDLNDRLTDTSSKLKDRLISFTQLQTSLDKWKLENKSLASRLQDKQTAFLALTKDLEKAMEQMKDLKKYNEKINDELRKERECGHSSSVTVEEQNLKIAELTEKLESLDKELEDLGPYRYQYETLKKRCQDYEQSLEEVGAQLRESRLEVENLKENSSVFLDSQWMDSKQVKECALCQQSFSVTRRKHHCRLCGNVFCQTCSDNKMELASSAKPARVCDTCHAFLLAKFVKSASSSTNLVST